LGIANEIGSGGKGKGDAAYVCKVVAIPSSTLIFSVQAISHLDQRMIGKGKLYLQVVKRPDTIPLTKIGYADFHINMRKIKEDGRVKCISVWTDDLPILGGAQGTLVNKEVCGKRVVCLDKVAKGIEGEPVL
jgi:hypothetical protein